jgi:hypothetical protein
MSTLAGRAGMCPAGSDISYLLQGQQKLRPAAVRRLRVRA